ncbi:MAG: hypothetical protein VKJ06_02465 [Vampirovibrionales bacterium]|nr:hypothetical protein [Vampirovibrionales bacterium]
MHFELPKDAKTFAKNSRIIGDWKNPNKRILSQLVLPPEKKLSNEALRLFFVTRNAFTPFSKDVWQSFGTQEGRMTLDQTNSALAELQDRGLIQPDSFWHVGALASEAKIDLTPEGQTLQRVLKTLPKTDTLYDTVTRRFKL